MTRGPQHRTTWEVHDEPRGWSVRAQLDDVAGGAFIFHSQAKVPGHVCRVLTRMQRELNTVWHMKHGTRHNVI